MNYNFDRESDNQTVQQTQTIQQPIVTLEYLLNQNKMKEIALSKATHLIELYKIELQVKEQDYFRQLELLKQTEKNNYEGLITELQEKIIDLQKQLKAQQNLLKEKQRVLKDQQKNIRNQQQTIKQLSSKINKLSEVEKLNESLCRIPKLGRTDSGKDLSINKKGRYSQGKPVGMNQNRQSFSKQTGTNQSQSMKRSLSTLIYHNDMINNQQQIYRLEKTFLIDYLLKSEQKDQKIISQLLKNLQSQTEFVSQIKSSLKPNQRFIENFIRLLKEPSLQLENKLKNYQEIVKIQQLIIEELNQKLNEYQTIFQLTNSSLTQIFQTNHNNFASQSSSIYQNTVFQQCRQTIDQTHIKSVATIKKHKNFIKIKIQNMETQNKQLKRILEDMIKLIKKNQKIQSLTLSHQKMSSFTTKNQNKSSLTNKNSRPTYFQNTKISSFGFGEEKISYANISNTRTTQDHSFSKQKAYSQIIHRK